jgi:hypothetical protein
VRRRLTLVAVALTLAGCTAALDVSGTEWARPATGIGQASWDEMECLREASLAGRTPESFVGGVADAVRFALRERGRTAVYGACMRAKGYERAST